MKKKNDQTQEGKITNILWMIELERHSTIFLKGRNLGKYNRRDSLEIGPIDFHTLCKKLVRYMYTRMIYSVKYLETL